MRQESSGPGVPSPWVGEIVGVLLAAGAGTRFGGRKLLQPLSDGVPVGVRSLRNLKTAMTRIVAVVREGDEELAAVLRAEGVPVISSKDAWRGMGHSLASAIASTQDAQGWVVTLGDMPAIDPNTIEMIARELRGQQKIVLPEYEGQGGHPVGFPRHLGAQLQQLTGDSGARALIQSHTHDTLRIKVSDPGILQDVDTASDLKTLNVPRAPNP
ncbi:MAG: NTP transferase domain-containing protein [Burkholderiales bacterium]